MTSYDPSQRGVLNQARGGDHSTSSHARPRARCMRSLSRALHTFIQIQPRAHAAHTAPCAHLIFRAAFSPCFSMKVEKMVRGQRHTITREYSSLIWQVRSGDKLPEGGAGNSKASGLGGDTHITHTLPTLPTARTLHGNTYTAGSSSALNSTSSAVTAPQAASASRAPTRHFLKPSCEAWSSGE